MNNTVSSLGRGVQNFGAELLWRIRDTIAEHEAQACFNERQNNISRATLAMREAGVTDEVITSMLQKHFDLRYSETLPLIQRAHDILPDKRNVAMSAAPSEDI